MSNRAKILVAIALVALVAVGGGLWWFLRDDAPSEVSLEDAVANLPVDDTASPTSSGSPGVTDTEPADDLGVSGSWTVDTETGDFDYETATGSFVGFRIDEELAIGGAATAVGRTGGVTGTVTIDGTTLTATDIEADMTTITTNEDRRNRRVQEALETTTYPTATFSLTEPVEFGDASTGAVEVTAAGEFTIHGVTLPVEVAIEAQLVEETIVVVGTTQVLLSDFGVTAPTAPAGALGRRRGHGRTPAAAGSGLTGRPDRRPFTGVTSSPDDQLIS